MIHAHHAESGQSDERLLLLDIFVSFYYFFFFFFLIDLILRFVAALAFLLRYLSSPSP